MTKHYDFRRDERYLRLLSLSFPNVAEASKEIINLQAILNLPKGTEHFLADIHGEHEAFRHILKNASGNIRRKVDELFGNSIREVEKRNLCTLIYYRINTVVNIVDVSGNLVCKTKSHGGTAVWDGKLPDGRRATAGVYTALCNAKGGHTVVKILVIR